MTQREHEQSVRTTGAFVAFIAAGALCIAFYVTFRTYHASLEKLDSLTTLFHNPNARVASGDQGKRILKKLGVSNEPEQQQEKQAQLSDTLQKVTQLLQAAKEPTTVRAASNYSPPAIVQEMPETNAISSYLLPNSPLITQPLLGAAHHPQYVYPGQFQVAAPVLPVPQVVAAPPQYHYPAMQDLKVAISKPEPIAEPAPAPRQKAAGTPSLENVSKADLIKLLLTQLAKEGDLERQA